MTYNTTYTLGAALGTGDIDLTVVHTILDRDDSFSCLAGRPCRTDNTAGPTRFECAIDLTIVLAIQDVCIVPCGSDNTTIDSESVT